MSDVTRDHVADLLESISRLLELKGENPFKIRAYVNASRVLETTTEDIVQLARDGELQSIDGIGKAISEKLHEYVTTGKLDYYEDLRSEFPDSIFELFELQGLGAKKIKVLFDQLEVDSIEKLEAACKNGEVEKLDGFGKKTSANILKAIENHQKHAGRFLLGESYPMAMELLDDLRAHSEVLQAEVAGSCRRRKETQHDLDLIVASSEPEEVSQFFVSHPKVDEVIAHGATKSSVRLENGMQCDLRVVSNKEFPFALTYFTGSKEHNIALRSLALKRGWTLNEYRFSIVKGKEDKAEEIPIVNTEADLYKVLDLDYIEPELREDLNEIEAASSGGLPELIQLENLCGTFHNHTTASDGRNSLEEMAEEAMELGFEYLGISDHSRSSFQANGLDEKRLAEQRREIDKLNAGYDGFRLFSGVECDILKDGSLDYPDEVLAELDYIVASVHSSFQLPEKEMTERIIKAISNPHVTMLGHMTGRVLLSRDAYAVNIPAVIDAAVETGTIIELNANPYRLDMDWRWWPLAKEKGVKCAINPDAHSVAGLQNLFFGVAIARKGWLTRKDVINTMTLSEIESFLKKEK